MVKSLLHLQYKIMLTTVLIALGFKLVCFIHVNVPGQ